ncbi:ATP synthase subunit O, mitochondrial [Dorcoceras hygrometricum]|uniref:ATP synthase subunit O, mitochondrial n=1 Tax=Dorcoceras hygrometricum TaxID=472368 RepID=A0A2Z7AF16_9LAMI|nr:ATP synthase subunit O, mitochondrial [Dorcoceras hygrometricum]
MWLKFSGTDVPFRAPNKKKEIKMEYRLFHDVVAKALYAKADSFDVVTSEKFDLLVAISAGHKVNWAQRLETSPHDPLGITNSVCKNQSVMVSMQYSPFNTNIPIRSTIIGKSRVARDPITMHTSWRSNSDIACVTRQTHLPKTHLVLWPNNCHTIISSDSIGYPRTRASGESSTTKNRLLHASGPHPTPPPDEPN